AGDRSMSAAAAILRRRWWRIVVCTIAVFVVYQAVIAVLLVVGLGGRPNFVRLYPVWENARRIVALTPAPSDAVRLLAPQPPACWRPCIPANTGDCTRNSAPPCGASS